jgi:VanZ family protein
MPLGFCFCAYLSLSRPISRAILLTIVFGCAISFIIEATQFYLPTRDSDSMDLINNTLGTALGALCNRNRFMQKLLALFGIVSLENSAADPAPGDALLKAS